MGWLVNSSVGCSWGSLALVLPYFVTFQWGSDCRQYKDSTSVFLEINILRLYQFKFFINWHVFYTPLRKQYFENSILKAVFLVNRAVELFDFAVTTE